MWENNAEKTYAIISSPGNRKLIENLRERNRKVFAIPAASFEKITLAQEEIEILNNIGEFDWLIFTSVFAAECFLETLGEIEFELFELDHLRVCVFGEATADRLRYAQIHTDVIPPKNTPETIFAAIAVYIGDDSALAAAKFLIIKKINEQIELTGKFDRLNIFYRELKLYKAKPAGGDLTKLKALILGGAIDEFIFNTTADWEIFRETFYEVDLKPLLGGTIVSATSEEVRQTLAENDISANSFHI